MTAVVPILASRNSDTKPVRTLVVDDSVVVRTVIERILNDQGDFPVVHKTNSAEQALAFLRGQPVDLVLLDIELPGQSGLAALPCILRANPGGKVVILSGNCDAGSAVAVEALALGASDIVSKPGSGSFGEQFPLALIERLSRLFETGAARTGQANPPDQRVAEPATQAIAKQGIGAPAGGIHALAQLVGGMAAAQGVPTLVT